MPLTLFPRCRPRTSDGLKAGDVVSPSRATIPAVIAIFKTKNMSALFVVKACYEQGYGHRV